MMCVDANQDGKVDFNEFTERFHNPAKDIGFNVALLFTNLSEHTSDPRLERFLERARSVLDYFEPYLGRIEIMGGANRIERVYFEIKQQHIDQWEKPQIKDSKRSFLHNCVNEGGDKEKLELFVNFCEDTIFEMQHANDISAEEQAMRMMQLTGGAAPSEQGGLLGAAKLGYNFVYDSIAMFLSFFTWTNMKGTYRTLRSMTFLELIWAFCKLNFKIIFTIISLIFHIVWTFARWIVAMMIGDKSLQEPPPELPKALMPADTIPALDSPADVVTEDSTDENITAFGIKISKTETENGTEYSLGDRPTPSVDEAASDVAGNVPAKPVNKEPKPEPVGKAALNGDFGQQEEPGEAGEEVPYETKESNFDYSKYILSMFARNFYNFKLTALALAFLINFFLLFFQVMSTNPSSNGSGADTTTAVDVNGTDANGTDVNGTEAAGEAVEAIEVISMPQSMLMMSYLLRALAILHSITAFSMLVAYYYLKVPLVIFKREKDISRKLEFEGMWIAEQPAEDELALHWDKIVLSTKSFPQSYWDKFVKKKVRNKFSEQFEYDEISNLLGMDKTNSLKFEPEVKKKSSGILPEFLEDIDWQYEIWKWGVIFTDNSFLYIAWYFVFSCLGNYNYFFFAAHLMDVAFCIKSLGTILQSVTHNGKQLILVFMLTSIVVYIYTVIAFNFFRKFYVQEGGEDEQVYKCNDMLTCFVFHLYIGVRQGGGIGDAIEAPDGDSTEYIRILFDITFFFFVIVILLAIIQGLIIDAFGELRDQLQQVVEDMESKCFICGIGKDYFDAVPHGFEKHVMNEHNFANYMFFLMHLINKPDTEYTGQETYVWELYQKRCWNFFPVGDCFRKQNEDAGVSE